MKVGSNIFEKVCAYLHCRNINCMTAIVQRWGNSLAVRLPKAVAEQIEASEGAELEMKVVENSLILKTTKQRYSLSELIGGVTAENLHTEVDWGKPKGKEVW